MMSYIGAAIVGAAIWAVGFNLYEWEAWLLMAAALAYRCLGSYADQKQ